MKQHIPTIVVGVVALIALYSSFTAHQQIEVAKGGVAEVATALLQSGIVEPKEDGTANIHLVARVSDVQEALRQLVSPVPPPM